MKTNIKKLRLQNKYRQSYIAKILNITQAQYSNIENEITEIKLSQIIKLTNFYNVSSDMLLNLNNNVTINKNDFKKLKEINSIIDNIKTTL